MAVVGLGLAVVLAEVAFVLGRAQLPSETGYVVDLVARPAGGGGEPVELVMLGDSTVAGIGAPEVGGSLPAQVAQRVADRLGRPVHVVGLGISGARTDEVLAVQVPEIARADVVAVVAGSNDVIHVTPPWLLPGRTRRLLEAVHERAGVPVVLGGTPEFSTLESFPQPLRWLSGAVADEVRRRQAQGVRGLGPWASFVDIAALASPRFLGRPDSLAEDRFHPSPLGYGFWADALAPAIADAVRGH